MLVRADKEEASSSQAVFQLGNDLFDTLVLHADDARDICRLQVHKLQGRLDAQFPGPGLDGITKEGLRLLLALPVRAKANGGAIMLEEDDAELVGVAVGAGTRNGLGRSRVRGDDVFCGKDLQERLGVHSLLWRVCRKPGVG